MDDDVEVVDGEVVEDDAAATAPRHVDEPSPRSPARSAPRPVSSLRAAVPAVAQAAAVAAGGVVVGAVSVALARKVATRRIDARRGRRVHGLPVVGTRTFLVDVHLVDRS